MAQYDYSKIQGEVDFSKTVLPWDGFGFNYVEIAQTDDPFKDPQDLGGFTILNEQQKQQIIDHVFGEDGLKIGIVKMFLDPFHQAQPGQPFNHTATGQNMLYFVREGLKKTRAGGRDLSIITTLYGPPPLPPNTRLYAPAILIPRKQQTSLLIWSIGCAT